MISRNTIDQVFETARVEEVIGDFVQLKRAGSNLKGLSPFSSEKSPSFMVSPVKQIWKDFSSGKGGNAVTFIMEHEHFTFPEAIRYLAKKYGIPIEETEESSEEKIQAQEKESLYLVSEFAAKYFQEQLFQSEEGKAIGLSYFKERGFTEHTIEKFGLGYSPNQWDAFTQHALQKGFQMTYLEKTGLTIVGENRNIDRFKGRVMFPIHSMSGRVLGFGGRILTNDKKVAKYLNSPESEIYYKSKILYGIFHAKQAIAKLDRCYLVEGYTDVIQMHQAGIENVVASSGTALTTEQIRLIGRLTKNITVLFDGDAAGLRASIRGIDLILEEDMNVKVCTFPDGDDPDSFAKKTPFGELQLYLNEQAQDFIQFKASLLMQESKNDPIKKAEVIRDMVQSIAKIPNRIKKEVYIRECARLMDISEEVLFNTLAQITQKELLQSKKSESSEVVKPMEVVKTPTATLLNTQEMLHEMERKLLEILLLYGEMEGEFVDYYIELNEFGKEIEKHETIKCPVYQRIYLSLQQDEIAFSNPMFKNIYDDCILAFTQGNFDRNQWMQQLEPDAMVLVTQILMQEDKYELHAWFEKKNILVKERKDVLVISGLTQDTIVSYREFLIKKMVDDWQKQLQDLTTDEVMEVLGMINDYNKLKAYISHKIGRLRTF